ncbi:Transcription elongation factor, GreA/GreB family [Litoreibacter janthinus]|uniref:Transcription elongation factor, GreA/GreB family n=2 Tax=Litoreibacter janthinus TaxID=670154 RepID=A0A1I6H1R2_9RHOB|nr:Transcription elongation factor, GreA/GreB family [Litoreibacter janthinus]
MDKSHVKTTMLALTEADLAQAEQKYQVFLAAARLERNETIDASEQSQAEAAADLAEAFDDKAHDHSAKIAVINGIDFGPKDEVGPGAVVKIGNRYLVVGVSTAAFRCQGQDFIGISTASPIYSALEGKIAGDTCTFNGRELVVSEVH